VLRTLRAFAWMRWRVLVNSIERTGARDTLERFSLAIEQIGPIIALLVLVPSALLLAGLGGYTGYRLATGAPPLTFVILGFFLFGVCAFCIVGPLMMPSLERTHAVRLLLLPISRRTLYLAQTASALTEPWILVALPVLLSLPVGLLTGGAVGAAAVVVVAGIVLTLVLVNLSAVSALVLHLLVRDRRRGELLGLILIIVVSSVGMLPGFFATDRARETRAPVGTPRVERRNAGKLPEWMRTTGRTAFALAPSDMFVRATRSAAGREYGRALATLLPLAGWAAVLHGLGMLAFGRLLDSPASGVRRQTGRLSGLRTVKLPGLSRGAAAVAQAQLRLATRTPRGRSILVTPLVVFTMFAVMMRVNRGAMNFGFLSLTDGLGLAAFASGICLLSILPLAMNQFAIDRAGLTLELLSPLSTRELLAGKAVGNGIIAVGTALPCLVIAYALFPNGALALWVTLPLALLAAYVLAAPAAAALSAVLPKAVDLNSLRNSNAHGAAGMLGLLGFAAAALPSGVLVLLAAAFGRPWVAPFLLAAWCLIASLISRALFRVVESIVDSRKENLALVVS
jgi:hypothetical protein